MNKTLKDLSEEFLTTLAPIRGQGDFKKQFELLEKYYNALTIAVEQVGEKEVYEIFGYGSLMNERSRARTMKPIDLEYGKVVGYRRIYNLSISNGTCLNVEPHEAGIIDGVICSLNKEDMLSFLIREIQYELVFETTTDGLEVVMVMAPANSIAVVAPEAPSNQASMPRLDYIQACFHGLNKFKKGNLFFSEDNILFNGITLRSFLLDLSPTGTLKDYWKKFDSNY